MLLSLFSLRKTRKIPFLSSSVRLLPQHSWFTCSRLVEHHDRVVENLVLWQRLAVVVDDIDLKAFVDLTQEVGLNVRQRVVLCSVSGALEGT